MIGGFDQSLAPLTNYRREQAIFAATKDRLQRRKRARWRLWLALRVAGSKRCG